MAKIVFPPKEEQVITLSEALAGWSTHQGIIALHCKKDFYTDGVFLLNEEKNDKYSFRMIKKQSGIGGFSDTPKACCEYHGQFSGTTLYYFECLQEFIKWLSTLPQNIIW